MRKEGRGYRFFCIMLGEFSSSLNYKDGRKGREEKGKRERADFRVGLGVGSR